MATPDLSRLAPRDTTSVEVPVHFDAFANGEQVVVGSVRAGTKEMSFQDSIQIRPWGLFALVLVVMLALPLALLARFVRDQRRLEDRSDDHPAQEVLGVLMVEM